MYIGRLYADTIDAVIDYTVFSDVDNIYNVIDWATRTHTTKQKYI